MAISVLSLLAPVKLLIDKPYLSKIAQMQIVGGGFKTPKLNFYPSSRASSSEKILITDVIDKIDSGDEALFYHPVFGPILAHDYGYDWLFSTQRFVRTLQQADENPNIIGHFMHVCSGGGEAWFLDVAAAAIRNCRKPVYVFIEQTCCSAAYYLAANGTIIKAYTQNDTIGSIGTMIHFWDETGYFEKMGLKQIEEYAHKSDAKNKKYNDLIAGNPEQYIKEELDPLQMQFEKEIRGAREQLSELPDDHPVFRGETFAAPIAQQLGLIDGIVGFDEALCEAYELGITIKNNNNLLKEI